jgi:hypothetical protein
MKNDALVKMLLVAAKLQRKGDDRSGPSDELLELALKEMGVPKDSDFFSEHWIYEQWYEVRPNEAAVKRFVASVRDGLQQFASRWN